MSVTVNVTGDVTALHSANNKPLMSCEPSAPLTVRDCGTIGPNNVAGKCPPLVSIVTPKAASASGTPCIGLLSKLPLPVMVRGTEASAAIGKNNLAAKPLSWQSTSAPEGTTPFDVICTTPSGRCLTRAPSCCIAVNAANSSALEPTP